MKNDLILKSEVSETSEKIGCQAYCATKNCTKICSRGDSCRNYQNALDQSILDAQNEHLKGVEELFENSYM